MFEYTFALNWILVQMVSNGFKIVRNPLDTYY